MSTVGNDFFIFFYRSIDKFLACLEKLLLPALFFMDIGVYAQAKR
jgi:hypothetical protein